MNYRQSGHKTGRKIQHSTAGRYHPKSRYQRDRYENTTRTGSFEDLLDLLVACDGKPYGAYKDTMGTWKGEFFTIQITRVQADPYAPPSAITIKIELSELDWAQVLTGPQYQDLARAGADKAARIFAKAAAKTPGISIAKPGPEILERSSATIDEKYLTLRIQISMPAQGRRILGRRAEKLIGDDLVDLLDQLRASSEKEIQTHLDTYLDHLALSKYLQHENLISFVADGSILPRASGVSDKPLNDARPFKSPDALAVWVDLPAAGKVRGMAIKPGITVIAGGGFHGKSTLLRALEAGVYAHIPGDGREKIATLAQAVSIRAEDGRPVTGVNLSPFVTELPNSNNTVSFSTLNASGSTSQAAAIMEAIEAGVPALFIDEDTSATNLMIRDQRMRNLVSSEPLIPLVDRLRGMYETCLVSTILVVGGAGDFLDCADTVLVMENWVTHEATTKSRAVCAASPRKINDLPWTEVNMQRCPKPVTSTFERQKTRIHGRQIQLGDLEVDLRALVQVVDPGQIEALARCVELLLNSGFTEGKTLLKAVEELTKQLDQQGLSVLEKNRRSAHLVVPRQIDIVATINRLRGLKVK